MTRTELVQQVNDAFNAAKREIEITRRFQFVTQQNIGGQCVFELSLTQRPSQFRRGGSEMIYRLNGKTISATAADLILSAYKDEAPTIGRPR
jgi:hypothetical protein